MDIWFEGNQNGRGVAPRLRNEILRTSNPEREDAIRTLRIRFAAQHIVVYDVEINVVHRMQVAAMKVLDSGSCTLLLVTPLADWRPYVRRVYAQASKTFLVGRSFVTCSAAKAAKDHFVLCA